jgi:hypothetical protein
MGLLELLIFRAQGRGRGRLFVAYRDWLAGDVAWPVGVAVWKVDCDLHPIPAFRQSGFGFALEFLANKPVE